MLLLNVVLIVILVALNGFFVATEFAVVASRRTRVEAMVLEGNQTAELVMSWLENPQARDRLIAAAQLGITIVSLALGSVGEKTFEAIIDPLFNDVTLPGYLQFFASILPGLPLVLSLTITTSLHVVLGEQVPKVAVLHYPERLAVLVARPMYWFSQMFKGFVNLLDWATRMVLRLVGLKTDGSHTMTYTVEELKSILSESETGGVITTPGREMLHAVLNFGELVVRQVMIPRTEIEAIPADAKFEEVMERVRHSSVTKFPVYEESLDQIVGVVHLKRILALLDTSECQKVTARDLARNPIFVPEALPVNTLLHRFRTYRQHIAIVLDEFGGTAGLVTLEDLMEEIVGEVSDPFDPRMSEIETLEDGSYLVHGLVLIEDVNARFGLDLRDPAYDTIAGFMLGQLGRIPEVGDVVELQGVSLKVEQMDALRVERISLRRAKRAGSEG
jgi:putative hemolysin